MKIAVCCSSSDDIDEKYIESSRKLLEKIFKEENELVFGANNSGIMGVAYKAAKQYNRYITGIAPKIYKEKFEYLECDTEILTESVGNRTEELFNNSDMLLFLPGGVGTIYEFISALEMKRSHEFDKPIIVYNETGFFDEMLQMLNKVYQRNFTSQKVRTSYNVANDYLAVMNLLGKASYEDEEG